MVSGGLIDEIPDLPFEPNPELPFEPNNYP